MALKLSRITPKKALNKAFLKVRPLRSEMDIFKQNLIILLDKIKNDESEEHQKNNIRDFLLNTYYSGNNEINTKGRQDLVIHTDKTVQSSVGVIIEAKRPSNKAEWITPEKVNVKALQELVLHFMRERVDAKNVDIKYLVATNIHEWYIFDATYFDSVFYGNKTFVKQYEEWRDGKKVTKDTALFYNDIAKPFIDKIQEEFAVAYFDIRDYDKELRNIDIADDKKLIALQKLLSPYHLLRVSFANDSNELNNRFYKELLHIIGLEEVKEGGKQIIRRKEKDASEGSMIENTINILKTEDSLQRLKNKQAFGATKDEQLYNVALELNLTWINRILFLKLLEGQLLSYHKNERQYKFLNNDVVFDYDEIYKLFHQVLAKTMQDRAGAIIQKYQWVPYLNSSLFEISALENQTIKINSLDDHAVLDVINGSILTKYKNQSINPLLYLFEFLDAYDFASEGVEEVQEDSRTLINASILGKIFEKINGYKDGSIYTPGFITMYMCRQAIRQAVVQKFKDAFGWDIKELGDIHNYIADRRSKADILAFNTLINSLRLCDPAVGSGHFLVSALNEMVLIKYELGILCDSKGSRITEYDLTIENDELIVSYNNGDIFEYQIFHGKPKSKEDQRLQKTLFHEKQSIIENCLFGVDINPNSVKICRLRLWIELLKNAYYKEESSYTELETLPNIDINIKCGNSLISRFGLDVDLGKSLKSIRYSIDDYRSFVTKYKNCKDREEKRGLEEIINSIKANFQTKIGMNDPKKKKLDQLLSELYHRFTGNFLFEPEEPYGVKKDPKTVEKEKLEAEIEKLSKELEDVKNNEIYRDAFEWRFEFPEVLNDNGDFEGFDVVVGNPPYIKEYDNKNAFNGLRQMDCYQGKMDIWYLFGELGVKLLKPKYYLSYIATNNWITNSGASKFRNFILKNTIINELIDFGSLMIFENASIQTMIMSFKKYNQNRYNIVYKKITTNNPLIEDAIDLIKGINTERNQMFFPEICIDDYVDRNLTFSNKENNAILDKLDKRANFKLDEKLEVAQGIVFPQDFTNSKSQKILGDNFKVGDGIFGLTQAEKERLTLSNNEIELIKPYYTSEQFFRYYAVNENKLWLIYTTSKFKEPKEIIPYPNIKKHLDQFQSVITSDNKPYGLHRTRVEDFFKGEKLIVQRKCPKRPVFSYTDFDTYVSATFYVIKTNRLNQKYLTGLLNSRLIEFWLKNKGKMQGNNFQIDKGPIIALPILCPNKEVQDSIADLVSQIIELKIQNSNNDITSLEAEIDKKVYELYELTDDEIKVVEGSFL